MTDQKYNQFTFSEALRELKEGKKVKLPEWTGYWFQDKNEKIKVFTRTGDVSDTPHFHKYEDRNDWQITDGALGFDFAILALKAGKLVTRKGWNGKGMFIFIRPADVLLTAFIPEVKSLPQAVKDYIDQHVDDKTIPGEQGLTAVKFTSYLCIKAADGLIVNGWLASQTDLLAEDWEVFNE